MPERHLGLSIFCHAILLIGAVFVCLPLYFAFVAGSLTLQEVQQAPFPVLPGSHFFENLAAAWQQGEFSQLFLNSIIVTAGIVVGKLAISLIAAFGVTYFRFPFRMTAFWLIFVSLMLPVEVRIIPTYEAVADAAGPIRWLAGVIGLSGVVEGLTGYSIEASLKWNMVNSYAGLILPLIASASATFLFRQFFLTVPDELCEAAKLDGAGPLKFFKDILLPLSSANIAALSIILFLYGWNQYLWPLLFTTDKEMGTAVLGLKQLVPVSDSAPAWNIAMSAALLVMLPPAAVILFMQRWFTKGLVDSGK
ncbi:sn-glycerol-3-phosphate ABC transporter permease protein UgpE 1 [Rhizobium phaseoli]|uniref:sn-glycerol-3-phosphate transport system permease protein UgpE n=1 Tax=Rhizobium phaseoli TaxID=396 RepID=A0A192TC86_9HYPH|nr:MULTISPECIES: ABC transporter permease subunit [Rhizobium]MDH6646963.1 sn-glycerol 3-phosphate transport system permease protein [Rhizobium esperanzae]ANL28708.1 sn-glycerol-3-phosphate ABC transporter permease protein UgpE 1 [Rhizobium phaseoli]ANL41240.1 sn-glycerol-3-phosphate ABC transporter permease protein UgpE 1 [Rhizobium phaseoli]ANL53975.1 sn-glycerol-3-phosphate ABC transporter permease protein UgpE 1 [Rhizobium phaseoli]ANL60228.1 sn-glycerol-3-phosphate ABC transporter permease